MRVTVEMNIQEYMYVHIYTYMYMCIYAYMYTCTCVYLDGVLRSSLELVKAAVAAPVGIPQSGAHMNSSKIGQRYTRRNTRCSISGV